MGVTSKTVIASYFETGDAPTESQFQDFVDSAAFIPTAGATGLLEIESTTSGTTRAIGAFGVAFIKAAATASAQGHLGGKTVGIQVFGAGTTASAQGHLALGHVASANTGAVGLQLLADTTTAQAQGTLGGKAVGIEIFSAATTASAKNHLDLSAGGKILQVVSVESDTTGSFSSSSTDAFANITGVVAVITPSATNSKILAIVNTVLAKSLASTIHVALFRDSTKLGAADVSSRVGGNIAILPSSQAHYALEQWPVSFHYVDSPSSTSELTYQLKATLGDTYSGTIYFNRTENDTDASYGARSRASITLLEIGA
jgi:hypothetical protein